MKNNKSTEYIKGPQCGLRELDITKELEEVSMTIQKT